MFFFFLLVAISLILVPSISAQNFIDPLNEDPYIDPLAVDQVIKPVNRVKNNQAIMLGINYGLNPIILLAPAVNLGLYWEPLVLGIELSDSEVFPLWEQQRVDNLGLTQFSGETAFVKWLFGENLYLLAAIENRSANFWNRTYNRTGGYAAYDLFFKTSVASLGAGIMRFNESGYLAMDIVRYSFLIDHSVEIVEHWETWTAISGNRDELDDNIQGRIDNWYDILDSPSGFIVTFGYYF